MPPKQIKIPPSGDRGLNNKSVMMKAKVIILNTYYLLLITSLCLVACSSNDDNWQPGEKVSDACQQVYFASSNQSAPDYMIGDAAEMSLVVKRTKTNGSVTVPIRILEADSCLSIPESVTFKDGEDEATVLVTGPEKLEEGHDYKFSVQLDGDNVDPYAKLDGSTKFFGTMRLSVPVPIYCALLVGSQYKNFYHLVYLRDHKVVFPNFFNSGVKLEVGYDDSNSKISLLGVGQEKEGTDDDGNPYTYNTWDETVSSYGAELFSYTFVDNNQTYYNYDNAPYDLWFYNDYSYWYPNLGYMYLCFYSYNMDGSAGYYYLYIYPNVVSDDKFYPEYPLFTNVVEE